VQARCVALPRRYLREALMCIDDTARADDVMAGASG